MPDASVDSIVTDPPYELGFMGKSWDASGIAYNVEMWAECLRVLKPGGHLLAFSGSRTYHRMAVAIEDAGFEIRDQIMWVYGSGFPKSLDVSKAIDKAAGFLQHESRAFTVAGRTDANLPNPVVKNYVPPKPKHPEAQRWQGWGTALKPAHEPIVVARKPLIGTVAQNVLEWGTGALNIDGCRVESNGEHKRLEQPTNHGRSVYGAQTSFVPTNAEGRWPANFIHDGSDEVLAGFPTSKDGVAVKRNGVTSNGVTGWGKAPVGTPDIGYNGEGSAARFFYCAKASKAERNAGLDGLPERSVGVGDERPSGSSNERRNLPPTKPAQNHHPTVKPLALMRYLVRLVTPPGGTVLDPFLGSGTTAVAAKQEGFDCVGIEMTDEYLPIIQARVDSV